MIIDTFVHINKNDLNNLGPLSHHTKFEYIWSQQKECIVPPLAWDFRLYNGLWYADGPLTAW